MRVTLLNSSRVRLCWGMTLGVLLCMSYAAAPVALSKKSPSQEARKGNGAQARADIMVADGRLSVHLSQADVRKVLSRIGEKAGFSLLMPPTAGETISGQFSNMELIQGLRRLLRLASLSYAMVYDAEVGSGGGLKELWVFGAGRGGAPDLPRVVADQEDADTLAPKRSLLEALASLQPPGAQPPEPANTPPTVPFIDALRGQPSQPASPPQPIPFLDALRSRPSAPATPEQPTDHPDDPNSQEQPPDDPQPEVAPPSPRHPFLSLNPRQRQP
jgi:hypothetical protein